MCRVAPYVCNYIDFFTSLPVLLYVLRLYLNVSVHSTRQSPVVVSLSLACITAL